jgi:hypothetical protein
LAKYGLDLVIFSSGNSIVLWFGAGHLLFSFLLLSSTKVFQSAFFPGWTSYYSRTSPSLGRQTVKKLSSPVPITLYNFL